MILLCESPGCEHGYHDALPGCPYCGTSGVFAHRDHLPVRMMDTECYRDYWLCEFDNPPQSFQMFPGHPLDVIGLRRALSRCTSVTFNGNHYDMPIIALALAGADNAGLKQASDAIIQQGLKSWQFERMFGVTVGPWDHIDLFEVLPGQGSLKMYGGKMHARKLQDLPIEPGASIAWPDRVLLREYCGNDLSTTRLSYDAMRAQLALRVAMGEEYGVELRSKSDAQIAEAVMKSVLPFKPVVPPAVPGAKFYYRPPGWLQFVRLDLLALLSRSPFTITNTGGIEMTPVLVSTVVTIGRSKYKMGSGGLHSMEQSQVWREDAERVLLSPDVAAYYPSLIVRLGIYPPQIGPVFSQVYAGWKTRRDKAKTAGDKKTANSLKTLNNGCFGKLNSIWSIFYAPSELIQVTVTGQLALLMLIERLELCGVPVISANTDGIVVHCPRSKVWAYDQCIAWWEGLTGFVMETTGFKLLASRDVNSYVGITTDGSVKTKGAYAPPEPGPSGWPNPTTQVCVDAVVAYLKDGVPLAATILSCRDVRQFVSIRNVKGGGVWNGEPLGKAVRWYYSSAPDRGPITYRTNGNKVAKTDGCRPMMELTEGLPADLDYNWYVQEARQLLLDTGVTLGA